MKINNLGPSGLNPYKKQLDLQAQAPKASYKKDKVEISTTAKELQQTGSVAQARQEKVAAIKQQVESGTYQIDSNAIAQSMINFYKKQ